MTKTDTSNSFELLNAFTIYFKKLHNTPDNFGMLSDVKDEYDTNKCMETFYDELLCYKKSPDNTINNIYEYDNNVIDIEKVQELYLLEINNEPKKLAISIITMLAYLITISDWQSLDWKIMSMK